MMVTLIFRYNSVLKNAARYILLFLQADDRKRFILENLAELISDRTTRDHVINVLNKMVEYLSHDSEKSL